MDYADIIKRAWHVTRRSRPLKWLALISTTGVFAYVIALTVLLVPLMMLPQLAVTLSAPSATGGGALALDAAIGWLSGHTTPIALGIVIGFGVFVVLGVLDVAAQAGMIREVVQFAETPAAPARSASVRERLREGFDVWWRVAGLLAVAALPLLVLLLGIGLVQMFTISLPMFRGQPPDLTAFLGAQAVMAVAQVLITVVSAALALVVQMALREAVIRDRDWRTALAGGVALLKSHLGEFVLMYVLLMAIGWVVGAVMSVPVAVVGVVVAVAAPILLASSSATATAVFIAILICACFALFAIGVVFQALYIAWLSAVWTLFWERLRQMADAPAPAVAPVPAVLPASGVIHSGGA